MHVQYISWNLLIVAFSSLKMWRSKIGDPRQQFLPSNPFLDMLVDGEEKEEDEQEQGASGLTVEQA